MNLLKTSFLNGIAVAVKVASALVLNKILAVSVGPAGYAVIGQFQNAVSVIVSLAGGVMATGVTKATAQHFDDEDKQHAVWQTAFRVSWLASIVAALPLLLLNSSLAQWVLNRSDMSNVFVWLAFTLPAMAANNILLAIVNGKKEIGIFVTANIIGSLISLLMIGVLALEFGLYGALVAFTINPAIVLLATATLVAKRDWFTAKFIFGQINKTALSELTGFGLMGLTSALAMPMTLIVIRDQLAKNIGLTAAGYWQASCKISDIYLMLVTSTLSAYYLPRLSEIRTSPELKKEIIKVYRFAMPIVILGAVLIYLIRDYIIQILFTTDFLPIGELFFWQLIGDVIKVGSWILAFVMLGRSMVKKYIFSEIMFSSIYIILSLIYMDIYGLIGVSMAYAASYTLYWLGVWYMVKIEMHQMDFLTKDN